MNCPKLFPIAEEQLYIGARPKETLVGDFPPLFLQELNCTYLFLYIAEATILIGLDPVLLFSFLKLADAIADSSYALITGCSHGFLQYCDCVFFATSTSGKDKWLLFILLETVSAGVP